MDLDHTRDEIIETIKRAKGNSKIPFSVFKVTGIASTDLLEKWNKEKAMLSVSEKKAIEIALTRVDSICKNAFEADVSLFIDAEDSWFQDGIDRMANAMMVKNKNPSFIIPFKCIVMIDLNF